jgi:hypothetical protein
VWHTDPMNYPKLLIALLCMGSASTAIAADPPTPPPTQAAPAATDATPASTSAPPAATAPSATDKAKAQEEQTKRMRKLGYKPQVRNGNTVYCKETEVIGTRFPQTVCSDGDTIEQQQRWVQEQLATPRSSTAPPAR